MPSGTISDQSTSLINLKTTYDNPRTEQMVVMEIASIGPNSKV